MGIAIGFFGPVRQSRTILIVQTRGRGLFEITARRRRGHQREVALSLIGA